MVDIVKGGGRAPRTPPGWADFTIMMECTPEKWPLPLCVLFGYPPSRYSPSPSSQGETTGNEIIEKLCKTVEYVCYVNEFVVLYLPPTCFPSVKVTEI